VTVRGAAEKRVLAPQTNLTKLDSRFQQEIRLKILVCHNYYKVRGGEDQCFEDEVAQLESHGHTVIPYVRNNDSIDRSNQLAVALNTAWNRKSYREMRGLLREHKPDVLHCTNTFPLISPSVYYAAEVERTPVVQALHNFRLLCPDAFLCRDSKVCEKCLTKKFAWPAIQHKCYRGSRAGSFAVTSMLATHRMFGTWKKKIHLYYTLTEFSKSKLLNLGVRPDQIAVKPNCVHPDPGVGQGDQNFALFAGRLSQEKGIATLIDAWKSHQPNIPLKIIGDGPLADEVKAAAQSNPLIEWLGRKPFTEVLELMGQAKVVVVPSVFYETFGRIIIEAYSSGTPVVASRIGAMQELILHGQTGYFFEPGSSEDLMAKVKTVLSDEGARQKMRRTARVEFESKYTFDHNFQMLLDIYEQAIVNAGYDEDRIAEIQRAKLEKSVDGSLQTSKSLARS
jgi:glycosyltransferase involved in cell wall biosynthesis